jgi:hypothetical protein
MIGHLARRSIIGLVSGFLIMGSTLAVAYFGPKQEGDNLIPLLVLAYCTGVGLYIWRCSCLAAAKGHSSAIILVAFLGTCIPGAFILPLILLLVLPDKNSHLGRRRHRDRNE